MFTFGVLWQQCQPFCADLLMSSHSIPHNSLSSLTPQPTNSSGETPFYTRGHICQQNTRKALHPLTDPTPSVSKQPTPNYLSYTHHHFQAHNSRSTLLHHRPLQVGHLPETHLTNCLPTHPIPTHSSPPWPVPSTRRGSLHN